MKTPLDDFLSAAKTISLREEERRTMAESIGIRVRERGASRLQRHMTEKQFFRTGKRISLTAAERAMGREFILQELERRHAHRWLNPFKSFTTVTAAVLIVALGGAGVSYAAESALPGDLLYGVKIHVNEEVKGQMMKDKESSARWQAERAERRLKEAEALARKSALTDSARSVIAENFRTHAQALKAEIAVLEAENNDAAGAVGMDFEAVLRAHAKLLDQLGEDRSDQKVTIGTLVGEIHEARLQAEEDNVLTTMTKTPVGRTVMTDSTLNRARAEVAEATKSGRSDASKKKLTSARRILDDAEGTANVEERMKKAREALRIAKEVEVLATSPDVMIDSDTDENEEASANAVKSDAAFGAKVRMRITKKALQKLDEDNRKETTMNEDAAIRLETKITGAKQLLDIAEKQMDAGADASALEASDMALKHVEEAKVEFNLNKENTRGKSGEAHGNKK